VGSAAAGKEQFPRSEKIDSRVEGEDWIPLRDESYEMTLRYFQIPAE
jgi:hypothetical protein